MIEYDVPLGIDIQQACEGAISVAKKCKRPVRFKFNDAIMIAWPDEDVNVLVNRWCEKVGLPKRHKTEE